VQAELRVRGSFVLSSRSLFVIHGSILSGTVRSGMVVASPPGIDVPIHSVEVVDSPGGRADVGLAFLYRNPEQTAQWQAVPLENAVLLVGEPPNP
jgi:hypothetical protein